MLHDSVLHHLLVEEAAADDAWDRFARELGDAEGEAGAAIARARRWGFHGRLDPFLLPAVGSYLRMADAVLVHSRDAAARVRKACPRALVEQVPLAVAAWTEAKHEAARGALGFADDEFVLVHLGFLTPAKGLETVLRAVLALAGLGVRIRLVVVGEGGERQSVEDAVRRAGIGAQVRLLGWMESGEIGRVLAGADLGLVPRYPTAGETSAAALRFLASGTPVVVAGYRQFLELPIAAAARITPGRAGVAELVRLVARLAHDREGRATARQAARQAWQAGGHAPHDAARSLAKAVAALAGKSQQRPG